MTAVRIGRAPRPDSRELFSSWLIRAVSSPMRPWPTCASALQLLARAVGLQLLE